MSPTADHVLLLQSWLAEHRSIVVKVARSFAAKPPDAADLEQELLLQLWLSLPATASPTS